MSFGRFARLRPFVTKEIFYVAWCDFGRACITCADDYRSGAAAAWQGRGGGSRIRFRRIGHRVWCARHQHLIFKINGGVCRAVLCDQFEFGVSRLARNRRVDFRVGACRASCRCSALQGAATGHYAIDDAGCYADATGECTRPGRAESNAAIQVNRSVPESFVTESFLPARSAAKWTGFAQRTPGKVWAKPIDKPTWRNW
jgi:hypothetical protein